MSLHCVCVCVSLVLHQPMRGICTIPPPLDAVTERSSAPPGPLVTTPVNNAQTLCAADLQDL